MFAAPGPALNDNNSRDTAKKCDFNLMKIGDGKFYTTSDYKRRPGPSRSRWGR